jgi:hypothetical membrane protein
MAYVGLEAVAARAVPGYRYAGNFISDLGRPDSPLHPVMNCAFVIQGALFFAGAALLVRARGSGRPHAFLICAAANAVGNLVVATVPSGPSGVPWVHVTGATLAILGGNAAILAGRKFVSTHRGYGAASIGLAVVGLASFALLAVASTTSVGVGLPDAVLERTSVYTIIVWQMLAAVPLQARSRND